MQATSKKRGKQPVAHVFSSKITKNSVSLASNERKTGKIVLRGIPKGRNSEKQCFGMPRRVVFCENEPSGSPEASKFRKTSFRGVPKLEKSEKRVLGAPRNMKTIKNHPSSAGEIQKLRKYAHRRPTKREKR